MSNEDEYSEIIKHIAENIRQHRKKKGFTQAQMIDFGFDIKNYQKLEYGKHQFSLHTVFRISLRKTKRPFPDSSLAARARRALLNEGFPGKPYVA